MEIYLHIKKKIIQNHQVVNRTLVGKFSKFWKDMPTYVYLHSIFSHISKISKTNSTDATIVASNAEFGRLESMFVFSEDQSLPPSKFKFKTLIWYNWILQPNCSGSNTFETMQTCSRQWYFELFSVNNSARTENIIRIVFSSFSNMKVCRYVV